MAVLQLFACRYLSIFLCWFPLLELCTGVNTKQDVKEVDIEKQAASPTVTVEVDALAKSGIMRRHATEDFSMAEDQEATASWSGKIKPHMYVQDNVGQRARSSKQAVIIEVGTTPVGFQQYRFIVKKTKSGLGTTKYSELVLKDEHGELIDLRNENLVKDVGIKDTEEGHKSSVDNVAEIMDGNTQTSCEFYAGQSVVVRLKTGVYVGSFGFKTSREADEVGFDPSSFAFEGSMDGKEWVTLAYKEKYETPDAREAMVGPFVISKAGLTDAMKMKSTTVHPSTTGEDMSVRIPTSSRPAFVIATTTTPVATTTTTVDKISVAINNATKDALPVPEIKAAEALASAVKKKVDNKDSISMHERILHAAGQSGMSPWQMSSITAALHRANPDHHDEILTVWQAAASAAGGKYMSPQNVPDKVANLVTATEEVGITLDAVARDAAIGARAAASRLTTLAPPDAPSNILGRIVRAAQGAGLNSTKQAAIAGELEHHSDNEQEAVVNVLTAAGLMMPTTQSPSVSVPAFDSDNAAAKAVGQAVSEALKDMSISAEEKIETAAAAAAAAAAIPSLTATTTWDGVKLVLDAAIAAGIDTEEQKVKVTAEAATLSKDEQIASANALYAAAGKNLTIPSSQGAPKGLLPPSEQVAKVVEAAAETGMSEDEIAQVAAEAAAAVAATEPHSPSPPAAHDATLETMVKFAKAAGMHESQLSALVTEASKLDPDTMHSLMRTMVAAAARAHPDAARLFAKEHPEFTSDMQMPVNSNKRSWPELHGQHPDTAVATIKAARPDVTVQVLQHGWAASADHQDDRVRVWLDKEGLVDTARIG